MFEKELKQIEQDNGQKIVKTLEFDCPTNANHFQPPASATGVNLGDTLMHEIELQTNPFQDAPDLSNLSELNLHKIGLSNSDTEPIRNFTTLKKLTLSFNQLTSLKDLSNMVRPILYQHSDFFKNL
jgi:Leucine-rich repeat (LRR) protein